MGAHAFHPKPPRNRRLNEAWAGNILPFPRKSPDFFWSPYPRLTLPLCPSALLSSLFALPALSSPSIRSIDLRSSSSLLPSSSFVSCLLRVSLSSFIPRSFLAYSRFIRHSSPGISLYVYLSLLLQRREISTITGNSIIMMSLHNSTPSRVLYLNFILRC